VSGYSAKDKDQLEYRIYQTILDEPRIYYHNGANKCGVTRNTFTRHWYDGLRDQVFFPPAIRLKMFQNRKEYIYLIRNDKAHELYRYYMNHPDVVYLTYTLGKFDLLIQTRTPLDVNPDSTILFGSRSNYMYPKTPNYSFEIAFDRMNALLDQHHTPSHIEITYPEEPVLEGAKYGWMIFPFIKYDLRTNYTRIVKKVNISFFSFYRGLDYLLSVSTVLLPYYPLGYRQYSHNLYVIWSDYEDFICDFFGCLPSHVSIFKVEDALIIYASTLLALNYEFFDFCYRMLTLGLVKRFWTANPLYHWIPDI
jgi:hypothetical protein